MLNSKAPKSRWDSLLQCSSKFAPMLEQMAPLIQRMQSRIGKKRMARLVQMAEPLMSMMPSGDGSALGVDGLTSLSGDVRGRHARRHK